MRAATSARSNAQMLRSASALGPRSRIASKSRSASIAFQSMADQSIGGPSDRRKRFEKRFRLVRSGYGPSEL